MEPLTCQVEAPADLPEGSVFDVMVDGIVVRDSFKRRIVCVLFYTFSILHLGRVGF